MAFNAEPPVLRPVQSTMMDRRFATMDSVKASHCLAADAASTLMPQDIEFMQTALALAGRAAAEGEVPVGALVVANNIVVSQAYNRREQWQDPTAHAELIAIREAAARLGTWRLTEATLYVTLEPCTMCIGAIILSRISRLVYGARDPKAGACGSVFDIPPEPRLNHRVEVQGGVGEEESQSLLREFFRRLRKNAEIDTVL